MLAPLCFELLHEPIGLHRQLHQLQDANLLRCHFVQLRPHRCHDRLAEVEICGVDIHLAELIPHLPGELLAVEPGLIRWENAVRLELLLDRRTLGLLPQIGRASCRERV